MNKLFNDRVMRLAVNLLLVSLGALSALCIAEASLRLAGAKFDEDQSFGRMDPDARFGWIYHPDQEVEYCETPVRADCIILRTNSRSLREDLNAEIGRLSGTRRILVVGDSQTAGEYVENGETYANILEALLNRNGSVDHYEVLNAGVPAYSTVQEWLWYRELGVQYEAEVLFLGLYVGNDLIELIESGPSPHPYLELLADGSVELRNPPVSSSGSGSSRGSRSRIGGLKSLFRSLSIYQLLRQALKGSALAVPLEAIGLLAPDPHWSRSPLPDDARPRAAADCHGCLLQSLSQSYFFMAFPAKEAEAERILEATLEALKSEAEASGTRLVLLLIPSKMAVEPETENSLPRTLRHLGMEEIDAFAFDTHLQALLLALCEKSGVEAWDLLPALSAFHGQHPDEPLYFNADWHLSPAGHRVVAEEIFENLDHDLLDPSGNANPSQAAP